MIDPDVCYYLLDHAIISDEYNGDLLGLCILCIFGSYIVYLVPVPWIYAPRGWLD